MRRAFVVFPAVVLLLAVSPAFSTPTLDQHQDATNGSITTDGWNLGQTFTAGLSGLLDHIEVRGMGQHFAPPITVEIRNTIGGMPGSTSNILGSVYMATGFTPLLDWNSIDFLSQNIPMSAGSMYSIVLRQTGTGSDRNFVGFDLWVPTVDSDPYDRGRLWIDSGSGWMVYVNDLTTGQEADMQFRTYVGTGPTIPAPGAIVLAGIGATLVGWLRRRRTV